MTTKTKTVLVAGATGKQGGALTRALLRKGIEVKALTRKPESEAAKQLELLGAQLATGDFNDRDSLREAMKNVDSVFVMSTPFEGGEATETRQSINAIEAAREAQVKQFIFTSIGNVDKKIGVSFYDSKYKVEEYLKKSGLTYTIVAPVYFMENLFAPRNLPILQQGILPLALPAQRKLAQIALADIATFVALVIEQPERFASKRIDIVGEEISGEEMTAVVSKVSGRQMNFHEVSIDELKNLLKHMPTAHGIPSMFEWFNRVGYSIDIAALHKEYPEIKWHTFESWAKQQDWTSILKMAEATA